MDDETISKQVFGMQNKPEFLVVCGPTASGKTQIGIQLAKALNGEIICCDSVQIYKGFDLGSAKPTQGEQSQAPHHLFDLYEWHENCDAAIYAAKAKMAIAEIRARGRIPVVVGGTGLYLRALLGEQWDDGVPSDQALRAALNERSSEDLFQELKRLDPRRALELHPNDRFRVIRALEINQLTGAPVPAVKKSTSVHRQHFLINIEMPRDELYQRINLRTKLMIEAGLKEEVQSLLDQGVSADCKPMNSIGYKETLGLIRGDYDFKKWEELVATSTRQYAKRQMTWFKKVDTDAKLCRLSDLPDLIQRLKLLI